MAKLPGHVEWLRPSARQRDGSLWPLMPGEKRPQVIELARASWPRRRSKKRLLQAKEFVWLRDNLHLAEAQATGFSGSIPRHETMSRARNLDCRAACRA